MAIARTGRLFMVNGSIVPDYAIRPVQTVGVQYGDTNAVDLFGRPVGARGWPYIVLRWERISVKGLQWWENQIGDGFHSTPVINLTLPDRRGTKRLEGYLYHNKFVRGILWRPVIDEGGDIKLYNNEEWIEGGVTIRITELGRSGR